MTDYTTCINVNKLTEADMLERITTDELKSTPSAS